MANIMVDFQDTLNKVKKIEQLSVEVRNATNKHVDEIGNNVSSVWSGDGAGKYQKKIEKVDTRIKNRAKALERNASGLKTSVNRLKRAEEYAKNLFSK